MDPNLSNTVIQILGSAVAFAAIKFYDARRDRRARARVEAKADTAATQATDAATKATTAAAASQKSKDASNETNQALLLLAEELGRSRDDSRKTLAAMDRMAEQNDNWLGAYTRLIAVMRQFDTRARALEEWAAQDETNRRETVPARSDSFGVPDGDQ